LLIGSRLLRQAGFFFAGTIPGYRIKWKLSTFIPLKKRMKEHYPYLSERIQSTFIDMLVIISMMLIFTSILDKFEDVPEWVRIILFVFLFIIYEPLCMSLGFTLGNYLKKIRVRKESDITKRINFFQAIIRYPVKVLLGWLSFITINNNSKRRAIHDLVSGSVMIKL
jgi:uncharacterized RDD family membrane protein YckC